MDPIRNTPAGPSYDPNEIVDPWKDTEPKSETAPATTASTPTQLDPLIVDPWEKDFEAKWGKRLGTFDDPWSGRATSPPQLNPLLVDPWKR